MSNKPKNLSDIDRFWDLNSLLPKKRPVSPVPRQVNTDTHIIDVGCGVSDSGTPVPPRHNQIDSTDADIHNTTRQLNKPSAQINTGEYRSKPLDPYLIYTPSKGIIRRVEVSRWDSHFNFYENFRKDAKRLWTRTSDECAHVSFFSYIPQYNQLKYSQLKWYLWWRDNVRRGVYIRADFCYILLYIYEIINCPDLMPPAEGLLRLTDIWLNYRSEHRRIDSYMCEWLCDYCLINQLSCPTHKLEPILGDIVAGARLKEFYINNSDQNAAGAGMLAHSSMYDWRKSRYITSDTLPIFTTHIKGAFEKAYKEILSDGDGEFAKEIRIERSSYDGALCVYDIKRAIAVEYISYTRSPKFRLVVTDIIKYSENRIRMALGIKSRLKTRDLTDKLKNCIDSYFDENLPVPKKVKKSILQESSQIHEYDKLYEPLSATLSTENALKIEEDSWSTTELLTSAFTEAEKADHVIPKESPQYSNTLNELRAFDSVCPDSAEEDEFETLILSFDENEREALRLTASGDIFGIKRVAERLGFLPDALADKINETAFDIIGDSITEPRDGGFKLIPDYEGDIIKWLT